MAVTLPRYPAAGKPPGHRDRHSYQRANADQVMATDLASVIVLANKLRAALIEKGLIKGTP